MTLRIAGDGVVETCPQCRGAGRVPQPTTFAVRTGVNGSNAGGPVKQQGTGFPIPCPLCKGAKVVRV